MARLGLSCLRPALTSRRVGWTFRWRSRRCDAPHAWLSVPVEIRIGHRGAGRAIAQVVEDPSPPLKRYDPGHPDAGPDGYVSYPDINPLTEMVDLMGATRAYGLNSSAVQAEKGMITSALEIAKS